MNKANSTPHAGALVPATGRVTITEKKNGRMYIGCDPICLGVILALIRADTLWRLDAGDPREQALHRLKKAADKFVEKYS